MLSYWEKTYLLHYDYIVMGAGLVGLSTAISIKEKQPSAEILVLERGMLPLGASTRNAGFSCIGSVTEILDDLDHMPEEEVTKLVMLRYRGLLKLRNRLGDDSIGYADNGSYELILNNENSWDEPVGRLNKLLEPILGAQPFIIANENHSNFGFSSSVKTVIKNCLEGELNTGKLYKSLSRKATSLGIDVKYGVEVRSFKEEELYVSVVTTNDDVVFSTNKLVCCVNAFSKQFFPELDVQPGRGIVLITEPIEDLPFKGIFHFDEGYYYFREVDGRVLFGGGRNLDKQTETTLEFNINQVIYDDLRGKLQDIILPGRRFEIDTVWSGIMAFGGSRFPILKKVTDNVIVGCRMGGMGVAMASAVGDELATLATATKN